MKRVLLLLCILASTNLYGQWMTGYYSASNAVMPVSSIPWHKYTHIIHFATAPALDSSYNATGRLSLYYLTQSEINAIIASRPAGKKVLVSVKCHDWNLSAFAQALAPHLIDTFVNDIVNLVNNNGYDGVDIDWEHNVDVGRYNLLLPRLRSALPNKLITITSGDWQGLEMVAGSNHSLVNQINVMNYDMDFPGGGDCSGADCSWFNSSLYQAGDPWKRTSDLRTNRVLNRGVPRSKIGFGLPFYGRRRTGTTAPKVYGNFPRYTVHYRNLVTDSSRWQGAYMRYDSNHKADYLSIPGLNEFISYTGVQSIKDFVAWSKAQSLGGYMTFTLEQEYLSWAGGDARYPLSTALYSEVYGGGAPAPPPPPSSPPPSGTAPSGAAPTARVTTNAGPGSGGVFTLVLTEGSSGAAIRQGGLYIGTTVGATYGCWIEYWPATNTIYLRTDNNQSWLSGVIGTGGTIQNSRCSINVRSGSVSNGATAVTLSIPITFTQYAGTKSLFTFVADTAGRYTPWSDMGDYTIW